MVSYRSLNRERKEYIAKCVYRWLEENADDWPNKMSWWIKEIEHYIDAHHPERDNVIDGIITEYDYMGRSLFDIIHKDLGFFDRLPKSGKVYTYRIKLNCLDNEPYEPFVGTQTDPSF